MTAYEYVARQFNEDPLFFGYTYGSVGGPECLDTIDGDASHAEIHTTGNQAVPGTTAVTCRLEPVGPSAPPQSAWTGITAAIAWKQQTGGGFAQGTVQHVHPTNGVTSIRFGGGFGPHPDEMTTDDYLKQWATVDPVFDWPDALDLSTYYILRLRGDTGVTGDFRFTYLRVFIEAEGFVPLRQFHRDDGYGTTPPRAFGGASRIRTGRAYGYD